MSTLDLALLYADLGLSVFPLPRGSKVPAKGFRWTEFRERRADRAELREWFGDDDERNIGIVTGPISGDLVVRDFDQLGAYARWRDSHRDVADALPTVRTARGHHVYGRGKADGTKAYADGELRAGGTYVLAPSSLHPDGVTYSWTVPLDSDIPSVDVADAGFLTSWLPTERTEDISVGSVLSVHSALSVGMAGIQEAIRQTIPQGTGQRHYRLFEYARRLKAIPELAELPADALRPYVEVWHKAALPYIATISLEETLWDFAESWDKVRFPAGARPVSMCFAEAVKAPTPKCAERYENPKIRLLVTLCRELQRAAGDAPFFLACRTAAELLEYHHVDVAAWLRGLRRDGVLELADKQPGSGGRRAYRYRYRGDDM